MKFASLGSGSGGNSTIIKTESTCIMVDCGFSLKQTISRLNHLGLSGNELDAILVTHEHHDHWMGVMALATKYSLPVFLTVGSKRAISYKTTELFRLIENHHQFSIGDLTITPVPIPHDAADPVQYIFTNKTLCLGILTDLGHFTKYIVEQYKICDGLLLEANYDKEMLRSGPYPSHLKKRIDSKWGHLENSQVAEFLNAIDQTRLQQLIFGHISDKNNSIDRIVESIENTCIDLNAIHFAHQDKTSGWLELN